MKNTTMPNKEEPDKLQDGAKKPYEAPQVIYRAPLEATAGVCGDHPPAKANPTDCTGTNFS